jgi:hypothetical protein
MVANLVEQVDHGSVPLGLGRVAADIRALPEGEYPR